MDFVQFPSMATWVKEIWAGPSKKGAYGFYDVLRSNDVDGVIYDITLMNAQHVVRTFQ